MPFTTDCEAGCQRLHLIFEMPLQDVVRSARGNKLDTSNEDDLWSGRVWTGRQATKLGLIDGVGSMESVCKQKFGDKVCDHISSPGESPPLQHE